MKQFVQFYKKDFLSVLVYFILLLSCVLSSTVYLLRCRQYSIHPNVLEWILVLLQDMTTGVYCFPFTYILFFFYLMNNYFNRLECRIRLKSIKHFTSFSFKLAALSTGIWTATLFLLIFLIAFSNGFSFSLEIKEVDFLREFYGISIANNASFFIGFFFSYIAYYFFLSLLTISSFSWFKKSNMSLVFLFTFLFVESLFWIYQLDNGIIGLLPIFQYMVNSNPYALIYWLTLLSIIIPLTVFSVHRNWRRVQKLEMGKLSSHMWRLNQIIYTKYFWGYVLFWILICLGLWYWLEGNDRLVIEILKGPNLSQNSFLVLSIWLLHWFIIHTFFLAVVYRRRASDFFLEVIRFSSIKLWIRYQIWTCFLYGLILIMVKVLVIQFMLQLPNWDIGVLFIVDSLNACVLVLFCFMLYALGANVQMNFACVSFFLLMIVFGGLFVGNRTNYLFYILNRGNGDIGRDLFLQLLFLVFLFKSIFYFTRQKRRFIE